MADCNNNCGSCGENCAERQAPESLLEQPHEKSNVKRIIGVVSGKGGVGKSLVTGLLAARCARKGFKAAIMDADVTGPSIPKMFGISGRAVGNEDGILPAVTKTGIKVISVNLLLENPSDPVIWRGPVIAGVVKQFWTDVIWGDIDYMFIDMPPGTGDVPLTVFQSVPVDGLIIVASPQDLVTMIVGKAVTMAKMMNVPVLGVVENMSYVKCPHCDEKIYLYGDSHIDAYCAENDLKLLGKVPISPEIAKACDNGTIEDYPGDELKDIAKNIANRNNV
ncbi:MAG: Mrp/NBP35 family ATP-binding protein [Ruminococcus sp.]|jgi:Mrp family chromosome partitioning ATPase|nr:Mrp/NBP35 family ATP-binding protein [Ruminococcus sp.]